MNLTLRIFRYFVLVIGLTNLLAIAGCYPGGQLIESPQDHDHKLMTAEQKAWEALRAGIKSDDFWTRMHAAEALSDLGRADEVIHALEGQLAHVSDETHRIGLARELVRAGDETKLALIVSTFADPKSEGRIHAAESLWKLGRRGDGQALRQAARRGEDMSLRVYASAAWLRWSDDRQIELETINQGLADPHSVVCLRAAYVLGRIDDPAAAALLRDHAERLDRDSLEYAFCLMGIFSQLGQTQAGEVEFFASHHLPAIRSQLAQVLIHRDCPGRLAVLYRLLEDEHLDVRIRAAHAWLSISSNGMVKLTAKSAFNS